MSLDISALGRDVAEHSAAPPTPTSGLSCKTLESIGYSLVTWLDVDLYGNIAYGNRRDTMGQTKRSTAQKIFFFPDHATRVLK